MTVCCRLWLRRSMMCLGVWRRRPLLWRTTRSRVSCAPSLSPHPSCVRPQMEVTYTVGPSTPSWEILLHMFWQIFGKFSLLVEWPWNLLHFVYNEIIIFKLFILFYGVKLMFVVIIYWLNVNQPWPICANLLWKCFKIQKLLFLIVYRLKACKLCSTWN